MNDRLLRRHVLDELEFEPSIEAAGIGVSAKDGVVTLSGRVSTYAQKLVAERAAWRVRGVQAVAQEIEVSYGSEIPDENIAHRAVETLHWDATLPPGSIRVTVHKGWLTLEGQVQWRYQRDNAEADLHKLAGVVGITNNLTLSPKPQASPLEQCIEDALKRHAHVEPGQIRVRVDEAGAVILDGIVHNWMERVAVEHAAWSAPGVNAVVDHIRIV